MTRGRETICDLALRWLRRRERDCASERASKEIEGESREADMAGRQADRGRNTREGKYRERDPHQRTTSTVRVIMQATFRTICAQENAKRGNKL